MRQAGSYSRTLGDYFILKWREKHKDGVVVCRDVDAQPIPHLSQNVVDVFYGIRKECEEARLSETLINEIKHVDEILIACPMYNFGIPSTLKTYFDHVVRVNKTFRRDGNGYEGLLANKKAFIVTTRGGKKIHKQESAAVDDYLVGILSFIGINNIKVLGIEGTAEGGIADDWQLEIDKWIN